MKKKGLLFLLAICSFGFTGCSDEFGILSLQVSFDFLLRKKNECELSVKFIDEDFNKEYSIQKYTGDDISFIYEKNKNTKFLEYFKENYKMLNIFFFYDSEELKTRRNYKRNLEILIKGYVDGIYKEEFVEYPVNISYLNEDATQYFDFQIETKNFGTMYGLFSYDFTRFI